MYNNTGLFYNEIKPTKAPTEKEIIFCISLYFAIAPKFSKEQISYKFYLNEIVNTRQYLLKIQNPKEREVFMCFLSEQKSKLQISKELTNHAKKGVYLIDKNLQLLIYEIMQDYKNGFLQVKEYQKPKTQREKTHQANEYLKEIGSPHRIPLREPSQREILSKWEKYKNKIDQKATKTSQKA